MSNLCAFYSVVHRAEQAEEAREGFDATVTVQVPTSVILFAEKHINMLEQQLAKLQAKETSTDKELVELRSIASVAKVHYANHKIDTGHHPKAFNHVES
ncbi:hypothetical protein Erwinia_phage_Papaline_00075 [Erwinia phage Papaline]|nr:hypothetical protein Erwinia_phage_Papaline_00075 [Erwinia phage Papaline]